MVIKYLKPIVLFYNHKIDISKEYVEFSEKRLKNYKAEEKYANKEIAKHIVVKTFKERKEKGEFTGKYGQQNHKKTKQQYIFSLFEKLKK